MTTIAKTNKIAALIAGSVMALGMASAQAALSTTGPFVGDLSEGWEGFNTYAIPAAVTYLANPTDIMGGAASIANGLMAVYDETSATFGLAGNGVAKVAAGAKGMGLDAGPDAAVITFDNDQTMFGAYWGAASSDAPATVRVLFFDANGNQVGADSFDYDHRANGDGVLDWHGWSSDVAFRSVVYAGDFVVNDELQASGPNNNNNPVPEPGSLALAGVALLSLAAALKRNRAR